MHRWAKANYALLGWSKALDQKTIRCRFFALPTVLQQLLPAIARQCHKLDHILFDYAWAYADKSMFRALADLWNFKDMAERGNTSFQYRYRGFLGPKLVS